MTCFTRQLLMTFVLCGLCPLVVSADEPVNVPVAATQPAAEIPMPAAATTVSPTASPVSVDIPPVQIPTEANPIISAEPTAEVNPPALPVVVQSKELEQLDFANGLFQRGLYEMAQGEYQQLIDAPASSDTLAQAYFGLAESRFFMQANAPAIEAYQKYLELYPSQKEVLIAKIRLGHLLVKEGKTSEALKELQGVDPTTVEPSFRQLLYYSLAQAYQALNDIPKTMEHFYKATEIPPTTNYTILSYLQMGDVMVGEKDYTRAANYYTRAINEGLTSQQKATALFKQGQAQLQLGDLVKANEYFEQVLKDYEREEIAIDAFYQLLWVYTSLEQPQAVVENYRKYKKLSSMDPKFANIHHLVIDALATTKDYKGALALTDEISTAAANDQPAYHRGLMKKAQVLSQAGQYDEALKLIEENAQNWANARDQMLLVQAEAYYGLKDFAKAFDLYQQIVTEFLGTPVADDALYGMAFAKNSQGDSKAALEFFSNYARNGQNEKSRQKALYNAILLSAKLDATDEAIMFSKEYLTIFPSGEYSQKILYLLGTLYGKSRQYAEAVEIFTRYVLTYPESEQLGEVYFALAYQLQLSGKLEQSQLYYEKAAKAENNPERRYSSLKNLAAIYLNKNQFAEAAKVVEQMISENPENDLGAPSYLWLAEYYMKDNKVDDALRVLQASQKNTKLKDETGGIDYFLGEIYRKKGDIDGALAAYSKVLELPQPSTYLTESKIAKATILIEKKSFEEARTLLTSIIEANEDNDTIAMKARFALGELEEKEGHGDEAVKYFMLVAVLYKNMDYSSQALFKAAGLLESQGKSQEAQKAYEEIVQGYPQSPLLKEAKKRIEVLSGQ